VLEPCVTDWRTDCQAEEILKHLTLALANRDGWLSGTAPLAGEGGDFDDLPSRGPRPPRWTPAPNRSLADDDDEMEPKSFFPYERRAAARAPGEPEVRERAAVAAAMAAAAAATATAAASTEVSRAGTARRRRSSGSPRKRA